MSCLTFTQIWASNLTMCDAVERVDVCVQMMLEVINDIFQKLLTEGLSWHALYAQDVQGDIACIQALA